jgi:AcrR family transcriptional regulator
MLDGVDDRSLNGPELRERRRRRISREIERAALQLFAEKGYQDVTVEDIARAAEISERTFFRYFANKDDVLVAEERRRMDALCDLLVARDPREPAWRALHNAIIELSGRLECDEGAALWARITDQVPHLRAKLAAHAAEVNGTVIAEHMAHRLRADRSQDLLPDVMTQTMLTASHLAYRKWLTDTRQSLVELSEDALAMVERGLAGAARRGTVA